MKESVEVTVMNTCLSMLNVPLPSSQVYTVRSTAMPLVGDFTSPAAIKVSTKVPDGQSGPVAVKVFIPPGAKSTCSVMVKGTCEAARAGAAAPMQASTPATAASLNTRYITYPQTDRMAYNIGRELVTP